MLQEISNLLDNKEQKDEKGTIIDLNTRGTKVKLALEEKYKEQDKKEEKKQTDLSKESSKLPEPTGWRILVLPFKMKERLKLTLFRTGNN